MKKALKDKALTIRLPKEIRRDLENIAKEEKVPISDLIRESLDHFLAVKRFRQLRKKALPFAEAQGLLTDEDVFKVIS
ncbi:MAG: CopG family transcriptional regulator [Bdellovibrio sp.]|nr:MAG: CopG family transcriptional regulator [Bdellovibrio sp.]